MAAADTLTVKLRPRWHSRTGFLATTLLVLVCVGAPFYVTRGLIDHGVLFLPALIALTFLFGAPLMRVALALGQLHQRTGGREALHIMQGVLRVMLAGSALWLGAKAAGWIYAQYFGDIPAHWMLYQGRELTPASSSWHLLDQESLLVGIASVGLVAAIIGLIAWRRRMASMSWIATPMLVVVILLLLGGVLVGITLPGADALAGLVAPMRPAAVLDITFWGDSASLAMLAIGGQMGVLVAAGRALPRRAQVGREARILVSGVCFFLVISGVAGLLLLCAVCYGQGIAPEAIHAEPTVMLLEVIPALGVQLFNDWPEHLRPNNVQITMGWCFVLATLCAFACASLLRCRAVIPRSVTSRSAVMGYLGAGALTVAVALAWTEGIGEAWMPLVTVLPALLAVMRLTLVRRAGAGLRVARAAFASDHPRFQTYLMFMTFRVVRPLLLLLVLAVAWSEREHAWVLAGLALTFGLIWAGTLGGTRRPSESRRITQVVTMLALAMVLVACTPVESVTLDDLTQSGQATTVDRERWERQVTAQANLEPVDWAKEFPNGPSGQRDRFRLSCLLYQDSTSIDAQLTERDMHTSDAIDAVGLDVRIQQGNATAIRNELERTATTLDGKHSEALLATDQREIPFMLVALVRDYRHAYAAAGIVTRNLRRHLLARAVAGRTLLTPSPWTGVVYLGCFLVTSLMLGMSLLMGAGPKRSGR